MRDRLAGGRHPFDYRRGKIGSVLALVLFDNAGDDVDPVILTESNPQTDHR